MTILHEHLVVKKICFRWISHNLTIAQMSIGAKKCFQNTIALLQKAFIRSSQLTNHESMRMCPKQNNSPPCGSSKTCQIQRKLFVEEALRSRWSPLSLVKLVMWRLFHLSIVGRSILCGTLEFVCLKSSEKFVREHTSFSP